jgi:beta-glucosidase
VEETVQCYLQDTYTSAIWPEKKLKAWQRVTLAPGEVRTVTFSLPYADLAFCNEDAEWVVEPGEFEILVGPSSRHKDLQRAGFVAK